MTKRDSEILIEYQYGYHEGILAGEWDQRNSSLGLSAERQAEMREQANTTLNLKLRAWSLGWLRGYREEVR